MAQVANVGFTARLDKPFVVFSVGRGFRSAKTLVLTR